MIIELIINATFTNFKISAIIFLRKFHVRNFNTRSELDDLFFILSLDILTLVRLFLKHTFFSLFMPFARSHNITTSCSTQQPLHPVKVKAPSPPPETHTQ